LFLQPKWLSSIGRCKKKWQSSLGRFSQIFNPPCMFWLHAENQVYKSGNFYSYFLSHVYLLKTSKITLFLNFKLHFFAMFHQYKRPKLHYCFFLIGDFFCQISTWKLWFQCIQLIFHGKKKDPNLSTFEELKNKL
jgi:hypothetical protein